MVAKKKVKVQSTGVNTKFILMLVVAVSGLAVVLAGLWYYHRMKDATININRAEALIAEGKLDKALDQIGRAISKEPTKPEHLERMHKLLDQMKPETQDRAAELYNRRLAAYRHMATYHPEDADTHLALIDELHDCALLLQSADIWDAIVEAANVMEQRVSDDDPKRYFSRLYRGMSKMQLRERLTPDEIDAALTDLNTFVEQRPDSDLGWATLATAYLQLCRDAQSRGEKSKQEQMLRKADETLAKAAAAVPENLHISMIQAERMLYNDAPASPDQIDAAITKIEQGCAKFKPGPLVLATAGRTMQMVGGEVGVRRAVALIEPELAVQPDRLDLVMTVANQALYGGDLDKAERLAAQVLDSEPLPVSYLSRFQTAMREQAGGVLVDAAFLRWESEKDHAKAAPLVEPIKQARERAAAKIPQAEGNLTLLRADGKVAYAEHRYEAAARAFEQVVSATSRLEPEILVYSAISLDRIGQTGLAIERMIQALDLRPRAVGLMQELARMQLSQRMEDDAQITLDNIKRFEPDNRFATDMQARIDAVNLDRKSGSRSRADNPAFEFTYAAANAIDAGDIAKARKLLQDGLRKHPGNPLIMEDLLNLELREKNEEAALEIVKEGLRLQPNNTTLKRFWESMTIDDPLQRIELDIDRQPVAESERIVTKAIAIAQMARMQEAAAKALTDQGRGEEAAKAQAMAQRARARYDELYRQATVGGTEPPRLIDNRFSEAILAQDWPLAEQLMNQLVAINEDQTGGFITKARYQLARGEDAAAVKLLTQALEKKDFSSEPWRLLGLAYSRLGNTAEAARSFGEAYRRNLNDVDMVKLYVPLLLRMGNENTAMRVLREYRRISLADPFVRETWLNLEGTMGDRAVALQYRRERNRNQPNDRINATALARLLAQSTPKPDDLVDNTGKPKFTPLTWLQLSAPDQRRYLDDLKAQWNDEAQRIIDQLAADGKEDMELVALRAIISFSRGQADTGEKMLHDFIAKQPESARTSAMYFTLAQFQRDAGRSDDAVAATLVEARKYQDPAEREVDKALADHYARTQQYDEAIAAYEQVLETRKDPMIDVNIVETLIRQDRLEDAKARLKKHVETHGETFATLTLQSMIAENEGNELLAQGQAEAAARRFADQRQAMEAARKLDPNNPLPMVQLARSLTAEYRRTRQARHFDEAMMALSEAAKVRSDYSAVPLQRADLLIAKGEINRGLNELRDYLKLQPGNNQVRETLVRMWRTQTQLPGHLTSALEVVRDGSLANPSNPRWYELESDILLEQGDRGGAAKALAKAHEAAPNCNYLGRMVALELVAGPNPDFQGAIKKLSNDAQCKDNPDIRAVLAVALHAAAGPGQREEAQRQIRASYRDWHKKIKDEDLDPRAIDGWFGAARQMFPANDPSGLERLVMELTGDKPDPHDLHNLGVSWAGAGKEHMPKAIALTEQAIAACTDDQKKFKAIFLARLAPYYLYLDDYANTAATLEKLVALDEKNFNALNDLAYLITRFLKDPARAKPFADRALALQPDHPAMLDTSGVIAMEQGDLALAERSMAKAFEILKAQNATPTPDMSLHYGQVLLKLGRPKEAEVQLRNALKNEPDENVKQEIQGLLDDIKTK